MKYAWNDKNFVTVRESIFSELSEIELEYGIEERVSFCITRVEELSNTDSEGQLKRLIYSLSLISQYINKGILSKDRCKYLVELVEQLVRVNITLTQNTQCSLIKSDYYTIKGNFYKFEGKFISSIWLQEISRKQTKSITGGDDYHNKKQARLSLRAGNSICALDYLKKISADSIYSNEIKITMVWINRLSGRYDQCYELIDCYDSTNFEESARLELEWERACLEIIRTKSIRPINGFISLNGSHYKSSYLLESYLWAASLKSISSFKKLTKVSTLARKQALQLRKTGKLYTIASLIESAYDDEIPMETRMMRLESIFDVIEKSDRIDIEMLGWVSITRWLYRNKFYDTAKITLHRYCSRCLQLSSSKNKDVLGIASDLIKSLET